MLKQQRTILGLTDEEIDHLQPHLQTRYMYELCKERYNSGEFMRVNKWWNHDYTITETYNLKDEKHTFIVDEYGVILSHTKETF